MIGDDIILIISKYGSDLLIKRISALLFGAFLLFNMYACAPVEFENPSDVYSAKVGIIAQSEAYTIALPLIESGGMIKIYDTLEDAQIALSKGKCDAIVSEFADQAFGEVGTFVVSERGIAVSKLNSELADTISEHYASVMDSEKLARITRSYLLGENSYVFDGGDEFAPMGTLKMAVLKDAFPYSFKTKDGYSGLDIQIAEYICRRLGYSLRIYEVDREGLEAAIEKGKVSFAIGTEPISSETAFNRLYEIRLVSYTKGKGEE